EMTNQYQMWFTTFTSLVRYTGFPKSDQSTQPETASFAQTVFGMRINAFECLYSSKSEQCHRSSPINYREIGKNDKHQQKQELKGARTSCQEVSRIAINSKVGQKCIKSGTYQ